MNKKLNDPAQWHKPTYFVLWQLGRKGGWEQCDTTDEVWSVVEQVNELSSLRTPTIRVVRGTIVTADLLE